MVPGFGPTPLRHRISGLTSLLTFFSFTSKFWLRITRRDSLNVIIYFMIYCTRCFPTISKCFRFVQCTTYPGGVELGPAHRVQIKLSKYAPGPAFCTAARAILRIIHACTWPKSCKCKDWTSYTTLWIFIGLDSWLDW